jgi:hypothetical protein
MTSALGHQRTSRHQNPTSGLPPRPDIDDQTGHVGFAPTSEVAEQKKPPEGGSINLNTLIVDHAAINAGFDLRGQAMKPMPANPRIIMPM